MAINDPFSRRTLIQGSAALAVWGPLLVLGSSTVGQSSLATDPLDSLEGLRPEAFGAQARAGFDDTAAFEALLSEARRRKQARIVLAQGRTYAISNPFLFGGVSQLLIEGNGARIMNGRRASRLDTFDANLMPIHMPMPFMPNGVERLDYGPSQGAGSLDLGTRIRSVAPGAIEIQTLDGSPLLPGPALVYGWDRYGDGGDSVPPCARYFEWVIVTGRSGSGGAARLAAPLRFAYDQAAPEVTYKSGSRQSYGAARILPLDRLPGRFRGNSSGERVTIRDVEFLPSSAITVPRQDQFNGVAGLGGVRNLVLENLTCRGLFISCTESATLTNCRVTGNLEIDKFVGRVTIASSTIGSLVGGLGARVVELQDTQVTRGTALAPAERLQATDCLFSGDAMSERALVGHYVYGSEQVVYENCRFRAMNQAADRLVEAQHFEADARVAGDGRVLAFSRAEFDRSGLAKNMFLGARVYDAGNKVIGTVDRMPWCPSGDLVAGDVNVRLLPSGPLPRRLKVRLPVLADVTFRSPRVEGPFADRATTIFGTTPNVAPNQALAHVRGLELGNTQITIASEALYRQTGSSTFSIPLGQAFALSSVEVVVAQRASLPGRPQMFIGADATDGRDVTLFQSIDLTTAGTRKFDSAGSKVNAGDRAGADLLPAMPITLIRIVDPSRLSQNTARGRWTITVHGRFL